MDETRNIFRHIRIYDEDIWEKIETLLNSGYFRSFNDIINKALNIGIPKLYKRTFDFEYGDDTDDGKKLDEITHKLNKLNKAVDEAVLNDNLTHWLLSSLFNCEAKKLDGETVSAELMNDGTYSTLPKLLEDIQNTFLKKRNARK